MKTHTTARTAALAALFCALAATVQAAPPLSAEASDPDALGWMQGSPPPADRVIRLSDPDAFAFPKLRWSICHFRELMPTIGVRNDPAGVRELPVDLDPSLDAVTFAPLGGGGPMTWGQAFDANYTDGVIVLHHGRVVYERYGGGLDEHTPHGAMSVTKSLTGLLAEILVAEGMLDETALVGDLVPELKPGAFGDATVRQVMDMTTALDYSEDYADPDAEVWKFAAAGSPLPGPTDGENPRGYLDFLTAVEKAGEHGAAFGYKTVNADALGWVIARTTGRSVAELLSEKVWRRLGADREAFYTVDSVGAPFAGGGFNATLRDMARLGQMMLDRGRVDDEQVVPPAAIDGIERGGDRAKFAAAGYDTLPGGSYRSMWWHTGGGVYAARGVHGQTVWIDPAADVVIARFASHPVAANAANDPTSLPAYRAVADHLKTTDETPLLGREWFVEDIAGGGVIDRTRPSLHFLRDGRLAGDATCNRFFGTYTITGERLALAPAGTTRKLCPEALMDQERKLLDFLLKVTGFRIDPTGALILTTADGAEIVARR